MRLLQPLASVFTSCPSGPSNFEPDGFTRRGRGVRPLVPSTVRLPKTPFFHSRIGQGWKTSLVSPMLVRRGRPAVAVSRFWSPRRIVHVIEGDRGRAWPHGDLFAQIRS